MRDATRHRVAFDLYVRLGPPGSLDKVAARGVSGPRLISLAVPREHEQVIDDTVANAADGVEGAIGRSGALAVLRRACLEGADA